MMIQTQQNQNVLTVKMPKRLVFSNAAEVQEEISKYIADGSRQILFDLSEVDFIDSSGLTVLVATYKKLDKMRGNSALLSPSHQAQMLIDLTRLHQVFDIYQDQDAAIEVMRAA